MRFVRATLWGFGGVGGVEESEDSLGDSVEGIFDGTHIFLVFGVSIEGSRVSSAI